MDQKDFFYPTLPRTTHDYASAIFRPICRGESVTTIWAPMAGRRMVNKFIIENIPLFKEELPDYENYILVYIEPLDLTEESLAGYLRLMGLSLKSACNNNPRCKELLENSAELALFDEEEATYTKLLSALKAVLQRTAQANFQIVFFLGEFDELKFSNNVFYNNLKSLWDSLRENLHYVFLSVEDLSRQEMLTRFGELNAAVLENVVYVPLPNDDNKDYFISRAENNLKATFTEEEKDLLKRLCGGHPYFIKAATRILNSVKDQNLTIADKETLLRDHYELTSAAKRIYSLRTDNEKRLLQDIVAGKEIPTQPPSRERLLKLGMIIRDSDGSYRVFSEIMEGVIKKWPANAYTQTETITRPSEGLTLNTSGEIIGSDNKPIEDRLTRQEYELLRFFLANPNKMHTREDISEVLWGNNSYEKYSDWAIDQVMSKLRKKLKNIGSSTSLQTLRGRGYRLVN